MFWVEVGLAFFTLVFFTVLMLQIARRLKAPSIKCSECGKPIQVALDWDARSHWLHIEGRNYDHVASASNLPLWRG